MNPDSRLRGSHRRLGEIVGLCLCLLATGGYALYVGQDANWDQRNYHIYAVYSWLTARASLDLAPAQMQTWINPAPHLLQYLLIRNTPPAVAGFVMGALAGLNGVLLWILTRRVQQCDWHWTATASAALVVFMGISGSFFLAFVGTTFAEYLCSLPVLAALIVLTGQPRGKEIGPRAFLIAGLLLGAACGLKLTTLIYAIGMSATLVVLWPFLRFRLKGMLSFALGGTIGFAVIGGYWSLKLWLAFGNPMFPFFNGIFHSPWFAPTNFTDARFLPPSLPTAMVSYPVAWFLGIHPTSELPFREPRFAFVMALLPLAICAMPLRRRRAAAPASEAGTRTADPRDFWIIGLFFVFSYAIWLKQFGIQRYALPLELLTAPIALFSLERLLHAPQRTVLALGLLTAFALLWTRPPAWERLPYGGDWFGITGVERSGPATMYLLISWRPTAYVVPAFQRQDQFISLGGNLPLEPGTALGAVALDRIRAYQGPIRTLTMEPLNDAERGRLARFGMTVVPESCKEFRSRMDPFQTCAAQATPRP